MIERRELKKKTVLGITLTFLLVGILSLAVLSSFSPRVDAQSEEWIPFVPESGKVKLEYERVSGISYVDTSIEFPSSAFNVSDWGAPTYSGNDISVDAKVWYWTGMSLPFTWEGSHTFNLGNLVTGEYVFTFKVWGETVKNTAFTARITVPEDYSTIQEAINHANEGDTIYVKAGTYYENVVVNKTLSLIGENRETTFIDGNGTGTGIWVGKHIQRTSNVTIRGLTIRNGEYGMRYENTSNSMITESIIENQTCGILAGGEGSTNNTINNNIIRNCRSFGIELLDALNTKVEFNTIVDTPYWWGLVAQSCSECSIIGNNVSRTLGIKLLWSTRMILRGNLIYDSHAADAIQLFESDYNTVEGNLAKDCAVGVFVYGVYNLIRCNEFVSNTEGMLIGMPNNTIYHNNFIDNSLQFMYLDAKIVKNFWDNGYEGNYWSDYFGSDTNGDGIGDNVIPWQNVDHYPLINPYWNPSDVNHDLRVDIKDLSYTAKAFGTYPGHPRWNPRVDLNNDNRIDIKDLAIIAKSYGKTYS